MNDPSFPWFVVPLCFAGGATLIVAGLPLYLRRVPPNRFYGARFRSTLADDAFWYELNARAGRDLIGIGAVFLALLILFLAAGPDWPTPVRLLIPLAVLIVGLIAETVALSRAAGRRSALQN
jgi:uncharacterized membrane protein